MRLCHFVTWHALQWCVYAYIFHQWLRHGYISWHYDWSLYGPTNEVWIPPHLIRLGVRWHSQVFTQFQYSLHPHPNLFQYPGGDTGYKAWYQLPGNKSHRYLSTCTEYPIDFLLANAIPWLETIHITSTWDEYCVWKNKRMTKNRFPMTYA